MKVRFILLGIVVVAFLCRFWQLGSNPPSLTWDEVAWGYNAYSLGIDGRDEFGKFLPHDFLESFGDYKPPVYAYLAIIPVKLFGLTEFATRFPSAFFGTLTVFLTYFLTKEIFYDPKKKQDDNYSSFIGLLSAYILAISPWHINLSRAAFEANIVTFFLVLGVWMFLLAIRKNRWYLIVSAIAFVLSLYTFNTARIVAPLLVAGFTVFFIKQLFKKKKELFLSALVGILLLLPTLSFLFSSQASLRFREVNIFSNSEVIKTINQEVANDNNAWWSKIIHNRRFAYSTDFINHFFDNLNPSFLFVKGDGNPKFSTQDVGQMYIWELPFLIIGTIFLLRRREGNWWIVPFWLLVGIIPAATARETPHALRIEATLPTFQILVAYGVTIFVGKIAKFNWRILNLQVTTWIFIFGGIFILFNFLYYLHGYYIHYPKEFSGEWQYGYKESIAFVEKEKDNYDEIAITDKMGRPYIYYLFYQKVLPSDFRKTAIINRNSYGFTNVEGFNTYRFLNKPESLAGKKKRVLFVVTADSLIPKKAEIVKKFYLLNGMPILIAYKL